METTTQLRVLDIYTVKSCNEAMGMTSQNKEVYLEVVSQIGGAGQSACCLCSLNGSVSHMTHTGEGGFCYSGLGSLGGGKPKSRNRERWRCRGEERTRESQITRTAKYTRFFH